MAQTSLLRVKMLLWKKENRNLINIESKPKMKAIVDGMLLIVYSAPL
jgi:hypothetical protein